MPETLQTFNDLLGHLVERQLSAVQQGKDTNQYLEKPQRQNLLEQLKEIVEEDRSKLFDRTSLKNIEVLFDQADQFRQALQAPEHPAHWIMENPGSWFEQSYAFMFDVVSFLELVRFFASGKTPQEKELTFRALVAKLIKTQDTVRTIGHKPAFLKAYLDKHLMFQEKYPMLIAQKLELSKSPTAPESLVRGLQWMVNEIGQHALGVLNSIGIETDERAKAALERKQYYDALILTIRHHEGDLFEGLSAENYTVLVEELSKLIQQSHLTSDVYLFQHVKRAYMTDWLVNTLRDYDRQGSETFYQAGKAELYSQFYGLSLEEKVLVGLRDRKQLNNEEIILGEIAALEALHENPFYALMLKIYTFYKNDALIGKNAPLSAQALASSGDTSWEQKNIIAQVQQKIQKAAEEPQNQVTQAKAKRFGGLLNSLKKVTALFSHFGKKVEEVKKQQEEQAPAPPPAAEPAAPVLQVKNSAVMLETCFPVPKKDVLNPVKGQRQDITFSNSDTDAPMMPTEQEFIVNMFNVDNEPNAPINKNYMKFANAIMAIHRSHAESVRHVQKKIASGGNVDSFNEDVLYLKVREELIVALGVTKMGQSKNLGKLPGGKTAYFRLFVRGDLAKGLMQTGVASMQKDFNLGEKVYLFKEVMIPDHFQAVPKFEALLVDAFVTIIESLPPEQFELLEDENLVGFVSTLQQKASSLIERGLHFKREL